jgi:hypothetical protein
MLLDDMLLLGNWVICYCFFFFFFFSLEDSDIVPFIVQEKILVMFFVKKSYPIFLQSHIVLRNSGSNLNVKIEKSILLVVQIYNLSYFAGKFKSLSDLTLKYDLVLLD